MSRAQRRCGVGPGLLMEWAVGKNYDIYRPGTGKLLLPGAQIRGKCTFTPSANRSAITWNWPIYLYPKGEVPKYRTRLSLFGASPGNPGPSRHSAEQRGRESDLPGAEPARAPREFQPHMHLRGKAMAMEAILPDGTTQMLSYVDNFNFNWMNNYIYADDAAPVLPKGTIIHVTAWYDNTANNPNNPDPDQWVGYGDRTVDEMGHAWVNVTYISDEDYNEWAAKHKPGPQRSRLDIAHAANTV